ncbi:alpha/beta fold hydrolase [Oceanicoccus sp. KOV_DT_Chl]|uniref:alpha/beta fold hydrolase n=1 Tax=Oceanicoccus sp. KOV_DT_Chl TaxID=1904639 RepID=UPI001F36FC46|nr:alpha/beta fold hydrolase [Oceanicoccus sp. KOV_DT_Chl]
MSSGLQLHGTVINSGEQKPSPTLVLLHGLFGMGDNLSGVGRALQDNFTVYKLDLRNHGRSAQSDEMSLAAMAMDVAFFLQQHDITSTAILGHSLGGKVAMQLALNYPALVNRLIVADIAPVTYPGGGHSDVFAGLQAVDLASLTSRRQAEEILSHYIEEEMVRLFLLKSLYRNEQGQFAWRLNIDAVQACYPQLCLGNESDQPFSGPTLFIKGELSAYIQDKHLPTMLQLFPHAELKIVAQASHYLHVEKPNEFNQLVRDFLVP